MPSFFCSLRSATDLPSDSWLPDRPLFSFLLTSSVLMQERIPLFFLSSSLQGHSAPFFHGRIDERAIFFSLLRASPSRFPPSLFTGTSLIFHVCSSLPPSFFLLFEGENRPFPLSADPTDTSPRTFSFSQASLPPLSPFLHYLHYVFRSKILFPFFLSSPPRR